VSTIPRFFGIRFHTRHTWLRHLTAEINGSIVRTAQVHFCSFESISIEKTLLYRPTNDRLAGLNYSQRNLYDLDYWGLNLYQSALRERTNQAVFTYKEHCIQTPTNIIVECIFSNFSSFKTFIYIIRNIYDAFLLKNQLNY